MTVVLQCCSEVTKPCVNCTTVLQTLIYLKGFLGALMCAYRMLSKAFSFGVHLPFSGEAATNDDFIEGFTRKRNEFFHENFKLALSSFVPGL